MPKSNGEVERLAQVYHNYHDNPAVQNAWSLKNPGNQAILHERRQKMKILLRQANYWPLDTYTILEVGCGSGNVLAQLQQWGAQPNNLHGVDLLPDRIQAARRQYPYMHFYHANAEQLDFDNDTFDLVLIFTVFSSILDTNMAQNVAREIDRVMTPTGAVLWYDFRYDNPRNPHVRGMKQAAIQNLFPKYEHHLKTITLLPPLARRLGKLTRLLYPVLAAMPPLRTHCLGLFQKPAPENAPIH
jgi:SAM-dependent methyltransferase